MRSFNPAKKEERKFQFQADTVDDAKRWADAIEAFKAKATSGAEEKDAAEVRALDCEEKTLIPKPKS